MDFYLSNQQVHNCFEHVNFSVLGVLVRISLKGKFYNSCCPEASFSAHMLRKVFNEFSREDFTEHGKKIRVERQLPQLFAAGVNTTPHKALLQYFLVKHTCYFPI